MRDKAKLIFGGVGVLIALALVVFYRDLAILFSHGKEADIAALPQSFLGNRASYGLALFSLFTVSTIALRRMIIVAIEVGNSGISAFYSEMGLYRLAHGILCGAFLMGAGPDVVVLLLYGEAAPRTMELLLHFDRICDFLVMVPFIIASTMFVRASQYRDDSMLPARAYASTLLTVVTTKDQMRDHLRIVIAIAFIAAGLAFFK